MRDRRIALGIALGFVVAVVATSILPRGAARGELLSDCDGPLREIVVQYVAGAGPIAGRVYREFLGALPADVVVDVVVPDQAAGREFTEIVGGVPPRLEPVYTGHAMTCWARDRWLALAPPAGGPVRLLVPRSEAGAAAWPARAGDARIGADLAAARPGRVRCVTSALGFDGGDFVADDRTVFVTPRVAARNGSEGLAAHLASELSRRVVLLDVAPEHHAGMYMMPVGEGRMLVGDPSLARGLARAGGADPNPAGTDFSPETQAKFDAVAAEVAAAGYRVVRMPVLPGKDGRTWLTPLNAVIDGRPSGRVVYMPVYSVAPRLGDAAERIWRDLGYEVRRVDCTEAFPHYGSLRCLVNVLRRS